MNITDSYIDRNLFNQKLFDLIEDYLDNPDEYANEVIAVNSRSKEIQLNSPENLDSNWETYPITQFIHNDENGLEPDVDATLDLADSYFFLK